MDMAHPDLYSRCLKLVSLGLLFASLCVLFTASGYSSAIAQSQSAPLSLTAEAGFEGHVKDGSWLPVWVTLENTGPDLQGNIQLSLGKDKDIYSYPVDMPSVSRKEVIVYIFVTDYARILSVSYIVKGKTTARIELTLTTHAATDQIFGVMSGATSAYNVLTQLQTVNGSVYVVEVKPDRLPDRLHALQTLDALIISGVDTGSLRQEQMDALSAWIAGGHWLIVTGGADWQQTAAGFQESDLLPLKPDHSTTLQDLTSVQQFAATEDALEIEPGKLLAAGGALSPDAQVQLTENYLSDSLPLIIHRHHGLGTVVYLAFDPSQPPLRSWSGAEMFYQALFSASNILPFWSDGVQNWDNAASAAQTLPNLNIPSPLLVCGFLAVYLLVIGPVNFLLLNRFKRRVWSWFTIPATVVFCSAAVFLAGSFSRGSQAILNRLAVVQVWPGIEQARVDGLVGLFSPSRTTYDVSVDSPALLHPVRQSFNLTAATYAILQGGSQISIEGIRAEISGIIPLAYEATVSAPSFSPSLIINIDSQGAYLEGTLTNTGDLDLEDATLLVPGSAIQLGSFSSGDRETFHSVLIQAQQSEGLQMNLPGGMPLSSNPMVYTPYPYTPYDTTIDEIIGSSNYYSDRESYRRYMLVESLVNYSYTNLTRGYGITLSGWSNRSPVDIKLSRNRYKTQDNTLYLVSLTVKYQVDDGELKLTPGAFRWQVMDGEEFGYTPYNAYLYSANTFSFAFQPVIPLQVAEVKSLTLDILASGMTGPLKELNLFLFDFTSEDWIQIASPVWGSNAIDSPASFVSPEGTIWLRIEGAPSISYGLQITRSDFTLVVVQK